MATERPWPERHFSECLPLITEGIVKHEYELEMVGGTRMPVEFGMNPHIGAWISTIVDGRLVEILLIGPYRDEEEDPEYPVTLDVFVDEDNPNMSINLTEFVQRFPKGEE